MRTSYLAVVTGLILGVFNFGANGVFPQHTSFAASVSPTPPSEKIEDDKTDSVVPVGAFLKVKSDGGEHCSGYGVDLWKQGDKFVGMIDVHRGLCGDPPTGLLENIKFDPQTRKFSFTAKTSIGLVFDKDRNWVSSHDLLEFEGFLTGKKLQGTLKTTDQLCGAKCVASENISLPYSKEWSDGMKTAASYDAWWQESASEALKRRGPKW